MPYVGFLRVISPFTSSTTNRMYLVRSVTAKQLSAKDIRMTLLEHSSRPAVENEVDQAELIKPRESGFEREVFGMQVQRGYRVIP
jgi:hypothetical protein